jgi:lysophospholipase L1-like esterase
VGIAPLAAQALPDVVVVELGTNDASTEVLAANAATILEALRDVPLVVWQNTRGPEETIPPENNAAIAAAVAASSNATIADWDRWVDEDVLNADGVHVQPAHEDEMARLIAPFLSHWLAAVSSTAPTSCDRGAL